MNGFAWMLLAFFVLPALAVAAITLVNRRRRRLAREAEDLRWYATGLVPLREFRDDLETADENTRGEMVDRGQFYNDSLEDCAFPALESSRYGVRPPEPPLAAEPVVLDAHCQRPGAASSHQGQ